jgi:hypothetical protein
LFMDWDLPAQSARNAVAWDSVRRMAYVYDPVQPGIYAGVKLLRGGVPTCYALSSSDPNTSPVYLADGLSSAEKYLTLTNGTTRRSVGGTTGAEVASVVGTVLTRLAPSDSVRVAFAVLAAPSLAQLQAAADAAQQKYGQVLPAKPLANTATAWQVYPNPTNGRIKLEIPVAAQAHTAVLYNALGQQVAQWSLTSLKPELNLGGVAPGVYQLQLRGAGPLPARRLVVQH